MNAGLADWIAPARTALLVIDMQRDFADVPGGADALARAVELVTSARAAQVACIFIGLQTRPESDSAVWRERLARLGRDADREMNLCREARPARALSARSRNPANSSSPSAATAPFPVPASRRCCRIARACDTLVICGLTTECCVDASVRDAFERDFHVFVVGDACAETAPALHHAGLVALERQCAIVLETAAVLHVWRPESVIKNQATSMKCYANILLANLTGLRPHAWSPHAGKFHHDQWCGAFVAAVLCSLHPLVPGLAILKARSRDKPGSKPSP